MLSYLITDTKFYTDFKTTLTNSIEFFQPDFICFRDKDSIKNAKLSIQIAKYYKIPIVVNQHIELLKLGFDGIHFTSTQLDLISNYTQCLSFASTHNENEVKKARNSNFITFSPIFNSKGREGLGIDKLNNIVNISKSKVFGLGGIISEKEVNQIKESKAVGFASIRYFLKD